MIFFSHNQSYGYNRSFEQTCLLSGTFSHVNNVAHGNLFKNWLEFVLFTK